MAKHDFFKGIAVTESVTKFTQNEKAALLMEQLFLKVKRSVI